MLYRSKKKRRGVGVQTVICGAKWRTASTKAPIISIYNYIKHNFTGVDLRHFVPGILCCVYLYAHSYQLNLIRSVNCDVTGPLWRSESYLVPRAGSVDLIDLRHLALVSHGTKQSSTQINDTQRSMTGQKSCTAFCFVTYIYIYIYQIYTRFSKISQSCYGSVTAWNKACSKNALQKW